MRTKLAAYYDQANDAILFGVCVHVGGRWCRLSEDGVAVLFDNEAAAQNKRREYRRKREPENPRIVTWGEAIASQVSDHA